MGRRIQIAAALSVLFVSGCETWIVSSAPPDETLGIVLADGDRDIVQPLSVISGPVPASGIDVAFGRDQILIRLDRTIELSSFCVDVVGELCRPSPHDPNVNDIEVVNVTRGGERVPLARAELVTPVASHLAEDTEDPTVDIDPDLPGGSQPLASSIWLAIDSSYVFAPGDLVRVKVVGLLREEAEPHDAMPPSVLVFSVAAEDGIAPRVASDSFTGIERLPPHAVLGLGFSEPIARLSVNVEPPLYGAEPGDAALIARDPITGGELVAGRARSVTFLPPAIDSVLGIDQLYWFQVVSEDCVVDGLGACLLVPTQDESGSELAGGPSDVPVSWIRSFRTAPVAIALPTGWPRLAEHQEPEDPAAFGTLGREFTVAGHYVPNPYRGALQINDPISEIEVFVLGPSDEFSLGTAELDATSSPRSFSLAVDLASPLLGLNPAIPDSLAASNGGPVVIEARARTTLGGSVGLDRITIGLDLLPPGPPEITSEPSRTIRPSGFGDDKICAAIPFEGIVQPETSIVELRQSTQQLVTTVLLATVPVANGRFEGTISLPEISGVHVFARARDAAGNSSDSNTVTVHCAASGSVSVPTLELPQDGFATSDRSIRVKGTVDSTAARVVVSAAGVESVLPVSGLAFDGTFLAPVSGAISISVFAEDQAGDRSLPVRRSGTVSPDVFLSASAVSGDAQVATAGGVLAPFVVEARDSGGAPVAGVAVAFSLVEQPPAGGGRLNGTAGAITVATDSVGRAQVQLTLSSDPGTSVVEAFASRAASAPVAFHAVGLLPASFAGPAGPPARIIPIGGHVQRGTAGSALGEPFAALLLDAFDRVVPNTDVFFRLVTPLSPTGGWQSPSPCPGTSASLACAQTDSNGVARINPANPFKLDDTIPVATATALLAKEGDASATLAQIVQVDACLDSACASEPSASLLAVSLPGPPAALSDCPGETSLGPCEPISATGAVNTPAPQAPRVLVRDAFQNRIANVSVSFSGATNGAALFNAAACHFTIPIRGPNGAECRSDVVSLPTNTFGLARAELIFGNQDAFSYGWTASAAGISGTSHRISEPFDETKLFTTLIISRNPRSDAGAAMNRQEDPWATTVVLATPPADGEEDSPWTTRRKEEVLEFSATNSGAWEDPTTTSNPNGDFFNTFSLGPDPSQVVTICAPNTATAASGPLQHSFNVARAPVVAEIERKEFYLQHVVSANPILDTFAEVWTLRSTIRFSKNASPVLRGRRVATFNGYLEFIEIPDPADAHRNYTGTAGIASAFAESAGPLVAVPSPPFSGGIAQVRAISLSERRCKVPCPVPTATPLPDSAYEAPPETSVFARVFVDTPRGLEEQTDPALDGTPPAFPAVSLPQWVDEKNGRNAHVSDGMADWLSESLRDILATAQPGRDREILGLISPTGTGSPPATVGFAQIAGNNLVSAQYSFGSTAVQIDILEKPFRLNTIGSVGVSGGIVPETHTTTHALRATLRHEARHVWQDLVRRKPCSTCTDDIPANPKNNSDLDFLPEWPFKLVGKYTDNAVPGANIYDDSVESVSEKNIGWLNDIAGTSLGLSGEPADDDPTIPFTNGPRGPPTHDAADQLEINAFYFWACLETVKHANCP